MIICKYKFQNKEKFNGKDYCTLHNELCEDISFVCDKNCQVYEDYKSLEDLKNTKCNACKINLKNNVLNEIEDICTKIYEQCPESYVMRTILTKISEARK